MSERDQRMIPSSSGRSRGQRYEVGQKPTVASPCHDAQNEHILRSKPNLNPHYAIVEGGRKDQRYDVVEGGRKEDQHLGLHHNFSSHHSAVEGAGEDEQYSHGSLHNFRPPRVTVGGSKKDEQYSHYNFYAGQATVGGARKDKPYSHWHHNFSPRQAAAEGAGARKDEQYSPSHHNFKLNNAAAEEARMVRDRERDMREYEMYMGQDQADQFYSSSQGSRPSGQLERRSPVCERELYHMRQLSRRFDHPQYDEVAIFRGEQGHSYDHKEYRQMSTSNRSPHGASLEKNVSTLEENTDSHATRQWHADYLPASECRKSSLRSSPVKDQSYRKGGHYYWNDRVPGKFAMEGYYEENQKCFNKSRETSHLPSFMSNYRDSSHQQMLIKGNPSTSLGLNMTDGLADKFHDANTVPPFSEHSREYENLAEPQGAREYCPRSLLDPQKDHRVGYADMKYHQHEDYGHTCSNHEDYLHGNYGGDKNDPVYILNDIVYRETSTHVRAEPEAGYIPRPVVREPTAEGGMVEAGSLRTYKRNASDIYNDSGYTSSDFLHAHTEHCRTEHDHRYLPRPVLEKAIAESDLVVAEDGQIILRSRNEDGPGYISYEGSCSSAPVHYQAQGGHRYLRIQVVEEPIAQTGIVEAEGLKGIHTSCARGKEEDPSHISMDGSRHGEPDHRYIQRAIREKPISQVNLEGTQGSQGFYQTTATREYDIVRDEEIRNLDAMKPLEYYLDSEATTADFVTRPSQNHRYFEVGIRPEDEEYAYDYKSYANARSQRDRFKSTSELIEGLGTQRDFGRNGKVKTDELLTLHRPLKRKYRHDEEVSEIDSESVRLRKWHAASSAYDVDSHAGHRGYRSSGGDGLHSNEQSRNKCNFYLEAEEIFEEIYRHEDSRRHNLSSSLRGRSENVQEQDRHEDFGRHKWSSSLQGKWKNVPEHDRKLVESGRKYFRGYPQCESSRRYGRTFHTNKRSLSYKPQSFVDQSSADDVRKDVTQFANLAEDENILPYNQTEDSEAFKQKVNGAFLMFSKKLNETTSLRKLYKERSGSLFCFVCGRSAPKEFQDSERLARHAYMSHKAGLRHQHLGLFKAICVLMGWDIEVPKGVVTWLSQPLPYPKAMAQKEDLILWQPIIIVHNVSLSNTNHKEWTVISIDALGEIIRGKSFIKSRINICLGCPGDQSVMVVKFMATYTGLQEAEKLHEYFAESWRGRRDFEKAISNMGKSSGKVVPEAVDDGTINEESLLYGYMGIAEDLDKIDLETKRRCKIKSKQEIQDIADAPLKAE